MINLTATLIDIARAGMTRSANVRTEFVHPPIPIRQFDWTAWYDGEEDERMDRGWGKTEAQAISNLLENYPRDQS